MTKIIDKNPFYPDVIFEDKKMTYKEIYNIYVENADVMEKIYYSKHTVIQGNRGTGRTMLFKYLDANCQDYNYKSCSDFLENAQFFGVYMECPNAIYKLPFFRLEADSISLETKIMVFEYYFIIRILEKILTYIKGIIKEEYLSSDKYNELLEDFLELFRDIDYVGKYSDIENKKNPFEFVSKIIKTEIKDLTHYFSQNIVSSDVSYNSLFGNYYNLLLPAMRLLSKYIESKPIYIFVDDVGRLYKFQQQIINKWIACRNYDALCFKVSVVDTDDYSKYTIDNYPIELVHDYNTINLDSRDAREANERNFKTMANKRLKNAGLGMYNIEEILANDEEQEKYRKKLKKQLELKLEKIYLNKNPELKDSNDGILESKISNTLHRVWEAQLVKDLGSKYKYSGYKTISKLASGIPRSFLVICYELFNKKFYNAKSNKLEIKDNFEYFTSNEQDDIIRAMSSERYEYYMKNAYYTLSISLSKREYFNIVENILNGLTQWFKKRMDSEEHTERQIISFSLKETDRFTELHYDVLRTMCRNQIFIKNDVGKKSHSGGGREIVYTLNGILCPLYKLSNSALRGRLNISSEEFIILCKNSENFIKIRPPV